MVYCAFRLALNVGITLKTRQALTRSSSGPFITNCIDATRRRIARVDNFRPWWLGCDPIASVEGVSLVALVANTDWYVVPDPAVGIDTTQARTRINTFLLSTSLVLRTILVEYTLRSTVGSGSNHARQTGAVTSISIIPWSV